MNLERLEELCLRHLGQSQNPLVAVSQLLAYCQRDATCATVTESELLSFLRSHGEVRVVEGDEGVGGAEGALVEGLGLAVGAKAILFERVPTEAALSQLMGAEMTKITEALQQLVGAMQEEEGGPERVAQLKEMMDRAESLKKRLGELT